MSPLQRCRRNGRAPDFAMPDGDTRPDSAGDVAKSSAEALDIAKMCSMYDFPPICIHLLRKDARYT